MTETIEGAGLTCWLLDTRSIWPGTKITDSESVRSYLTNISLMMTMT
jgi:4'-phosphopantetheinyl transferase